MQKVKVVIQSLADVENGKDIFEGVTKENIIESEDITVGILEKGTVNGQTSLMIGLKQPDGTVYMGQMTANIFEAVAGALRGARERFEYKNNRNNSFCNCISRTGITGPEHGPWICSSCSKEIRNQQ